MRIQKLHCLLAHEARFWEWLRWLYYMDHKPVNDWRARINYKSWPCSDKALFFPAIELTGDENKPIGG